MTESHDDFRGRTALGASTAPEGIPPFSHHAAFPLFQLPPFEDPHQIIVIMIPISRISREEHHAYQLPTITALPIHIIFKLTKIPLTLERTHRLKLEIVLPNRHCRTSYRVLPMRVHSSQHIISEKVGSAPTQLPQLFFRWLAGHTQHLW